MDICIAYRRLTCLRVRCAQGSGIRESKEKMDAKLAAEKEKLADINKMVDGMSTEYRKL